MNAFIKTGIFILVISAFSDILAQNMPQASKTDLKIIYIEKDFAIGDLTNKAWDQAEIYSIRTYWSGDEAPAGRQFSVRLLWSKTALYVRFEANRGEPLVVSEKPDISKKTLGLWDRDVCEIFIAPDAAEPRRYFEFEVAPTGEWIDVRLDTTSGERKSDWDYRSGMESAVDIRREKIVMAIKVPWEGLGKTPKAGDVWLGNIFRCVGKDPDRGYLAWSPTMTKTPNFHVPERFGRFIFQK